MKHEFWINHNLNKNIKELNIKVSFHRKMEIKIGMRELIFKTLSFLVNIILLAIIYIQKCS